MIWAYPRHPSLLPGNDLTLHISTDRPRFRVEFFRVGRTLEPQVGSNQQVLNGFDFPPGPTDQDWAWPSYIFPIPVTWRPGCYIAVLICIDADGIENVPDLTTADGRTAKALFVVRNPRPGTKSSILYKVSWATFHAYNATGYGSLYQEAQWSHDSVRPGFKVTTRRPGGGTGGDVMMGDSPDYYDLASRRQTFAHWDEPFIGWLEANSFDVDYCTDLDLHQDNDLLRPYNLLLSVGHDEYWSSTMRERIDSFARGGGNVAYFSGNIDGWRIHFEDSDSAITCAKVAPSLGAPTSSVMSGAGDKIAWEQDSNQANDPENRTTAVSYYLAGGWWDGKRETLGYTVHHAKHWAYAGTGLKDGDEFGNDENFPLVGYEADGTDFVMHGGIPIPTGQHGTPSTFVILGLARLGSGWRTYRAGAAATMGIYTTSGGGIVFQGATTDWPKVAPRNAAVAAITRNVLNRLSLASTRILGPLPGHAGRAVGEAASVVTFVVDTAHLPAVEHLSYRWEAAGTESTTLVPLIELKLPEGVEPVTVAVTVEYGGSPIAFGSRTFIPLSHEEALRLEIVTLLREMVSPGDPSGSFVVPTSDPLLASRGIVAVNLSGLRDRGARLAAVAAELLEIWRADPTRSRLEDPRRPWKHERHSD